MRPPLGVMQGRLTEPVHGKIQAFPSDTWRDEFSKARQCGLELIEWIWDLQKNPLMDAHGPELIQKMTAVHKVGVISVCADFFLERPLARGTERERLEGRHMLQRVITQSSRAGIRFVTIPFLDHSEFQTPAELDHAVDSLRACAPFAKELGVTLSLETSLNPRKFSEFIKMIAKPNVQVNYDIGNSAGMGYDPHEEFAAYGDSIATVHIKDRIRNGSTVPLGSGDADFPKVFRELADRGYAGPFILQAARQSGDPMRVIQEYVAFVKNHLQAVYPHEA